MTFKEDFKPSRVYNKLVIDAINRDNNSDNDNSDSDNSDNSDSDNNNRDN